MIDWCEEFLTQECDGKAYLTPSCTSALELACMMVLEPGDEVIMPSWAFPSCANAVILRGAVPVFVDVDSNLNLDPTKVLDAIGPKTKAIMVIHYAGVLAQMDIINALGKTYGLYVIEDAAQAIGEWKCTGDFGCLSFHYTKNVQCGQGGAIIVKNRQFIEKAERMMHCGTDKLKFYQGKQDSYSWLDVGSQYVISGHQAEVLREELERLPEITERRKSIWRIYAEAAPDVGSKSTEIGNGHLFWFDMPDKWEFLKTMKEMRIKVTSHFEALHATIPGRRWGRTVGPVHVATRAAGRLVKLNTAVSEDEALITCNAIWPENTDFTRNIL